MIQDSTFFFPLLWKRLGGLEDGMIGGIQNQCDFLRRYAASNQAITKAVTRGDQMIRKTTGDFFQKSDYGQQEAACSGIPP